MKEASFIQMKDGTKEDYLLLSKHEKKFADNTSGQVRDLLYIAMAIDATQSPCADDDGACWKRRDEQFDKIMDLEFKDSDWRIYEDDHNWDISKGGTFIPTGDQLNIYVTGIVTTDASEVLQATADAAKEAENNAQKLSKDADDKKKRS